MIKINSKFNIIFLLLMFTLTCKAYAGYDTIKAKTIENKLMEKQTTEVIDHSYELRPDNNSGLPDYDEDKTVAGYFKKRHQRRLLKKQNKNIVEEAIQEETDAHANKKETTEVKDENKFQINADKVSYDDTNGNMYAKGHVEIISTAHNITLKANDAVYDKPTQKINLTGKVKVFKDGLEMTGDSLVIDLNEENILMDNPVSEAYSFIINAQESYLVANNVEMINGNVTYASKKYFPIIPQRFYRYMPSIDRQLFNPDAQDELNPNAKKQAYRIDAKEAVITCYKDHNSLLLKDSSVYYNNHKISPKKDIEIISDKEYQVIETNSPEIGTLRSFGTYYGYGFVSKLPKGQLLKIMPALVHGEGRVGVGILGRHRSRNSMVEAGYSTTELIERIAGLIREGRFKETLINSSAR